jgi:hypothetical protein
MHWYWCYLTRVPLPGRRGPPSPAAPMDFMARKGGLPEGKAAERWGEGGVGPQRQSRSGAMIRAKLFLARFKRLLTVPRLHPVISAMSS